MSSRIPRPRTLDEFKGQIELKGRLRIVIDAARARGTALPHTLLAGPPGLGKTTLAGVLAYEMGAKLHTVNAPAITRADELRRVVARVQFADVLFLDEIHALARDIEETLYPVAEDFVIEVIGIDGNAQRLRLPEFTLIGATTRRGQVSQPMRDRFQLIETMEPYTARELADIVAITGHALGIMIDYEGAMVIGSRARGVPRVANRLTARVADWAHSEGLSSIGPSEADTALDSWGIDELGLDPLDRATLTVLADTFNGEPAGVQSLALALGETEATLIDAVEPYLTRLGLMTRTGRGRVITDRGRAHLLNPMGALSSN